MPPLNESKSKQRVRNKDFGIYTGDEVDAERLFSKHDLTFKKGHDNGSGITVYKVWGLKSDFNACRKEYDDTDAERRRVHYKQEK